jgi:uncharacterized protein YcfL
MKKVSLTLLLLFLLVGCANTASTTTSTTASTDHPTTTSTTTITTTTTTTTTLNRLEEVANLRILDNELRWNAVVGANIYHLTINGVSVQTEETAWSIEELDYGMIEISIVASGEGVLDSNPVVTTLEFAPDLFGVYNFRIVDKILSWNPQPLADRYLIFINGDIITFPIDETTLPEDLFYDLSNLEPNAFYEISVAVGYRQWTSGWSSFLQYDGAFEYNGLFAFTYALSQTDDLVFELGGVDTQILQIEGEGFLGGEVQKISWEGNDVTFHKEYLQDLSYGEKSFLFTTSEGIYEIRIDVVDTRKPYLVSSSQINVALGADAVVTFELYDGEFVSLSGNDITEDDYSVVGNVLTISGSYIQAIFQRDAERTVLILGYYLTANEHITVGYLFIRIQS